jgi:Transposase DDE domain
MAQTRDTIDQHLAERLCWQAARRDDARVARRLYRTHVVDGVYQLDHGARLDDCFDVWQELGVVDWLHDIRRTAIQRDMVSVVQSVVRDRLKTLCGVDRMNAWPPWRFSDAALMRLVGFKAPQVRQGVCQRGAAKRQGPRTAGPIWPDTVAEPMVPLNVRDLEALFKRIIRALAQRGVLAPQVTGIIDATDLETTAP